MRPSSGIALTVATSNIGATGWAQRFKERALARRKTARSFMPVSYLVQTEETAMDRALRLTYVDNMLPPVLIVGAGPTGLNLALALTRRKMQCRLISDATGPGRESRAMVVQARTLEFYGQYGFAKEVVEQGVSS